MDYNEWYNREMQKELKDFDSNGINPPLILANSVAAYQLMLKQKEMLRESDCIVEETTPQLFGQMGITPADLVDEVIALYPDKTQKSTKQEMICAITDRKKNKDFPEPIGYSPKIYDREKLAEFAFKYWEKDKNTPLFFDANEKTIIITACKSKEQSPNATHPPKKPHKAPPLQ